MSNQVHNIKAQSTDTLAQMQAQLDALRLENAQLKTKVTSKRASFKVTEKGGISMYGLGRFPASFYLSQWEFIMENLPGLQEFIAANLTRLTTEKAAKVTVPVVAPQV